MITASPTRIEARRDSRRALRAFIARVGTVVRQGDHDERPTDITSPFGEASPIEGDTITAIPCGAPLADSQDAAFLGGVTQAALEGWIRTNPVTRVRVGAAVLKRETGQLRAVETLTDELLVVPANRLTPEELHELSAFGFPVHEAACSDRKHPMMDAFAARRFGEQHRRQLEYTVGQRYRERDAKGWLVTDGALRGVEVLCPDRTVAVVRSHETQFLAGADLEVALNLPEAHRTSVFERIGLQGTGVYSWYIRLWDWRERHILYGLIRAERPTGPRVVDEAEFVSRWLLAERAPVVAGEARWDRVLYPLHHVRSYLDAALGSMW